MASKAKKIEQSELTHKKRSFSYIIQRYWQYYLLLLVPVIYIIIFKYVPMYGVQIAFKNYRAVDGIWGSEWNGFTNIMRFFERGGALEKIWNTMWLSFYGLVAGFPFPIILALSLNYVKNIKFKKSVQMISYAPHFISTVVMVSVIMQFFARTGFVNNVRSLFDLQPYDFMANMALFDDLYVWSGIWQNVGFSSILYIGVLSSVDFTLHEAAIVDGANVLQRMRYVDLPSLMPTAITMLILNTGQILNVGFEKVFLLQNPLNLPVSEIISTYVYKQSFTQSLPDFGYTTAIGLFQSLVGFILLLSVNKIANKINNSGIF